ncbi:MAG: NAD(P)H-binding protein [Deltaproteobacteria bacterium]|nr:NAD(P)H-binding protein [Deltaproteobacteria bacterium]
MPPPSSPVRSSSLHAEKRLVVALAGATGFVGSHLIERLRGTVDLVALTRSPRAPESGVEWRECDLFSSTSTHAALRGADVAFYLVHSMMPSSRLFQGDFHDTDLLLADNFAKACAHAGVGRIVYLGGLVPPEGFVSQHLESRLEVEGVLQSSGIPVTCLRAGMVVGPGGSSFEILRALVSRLPWMVLPRWTRSSGQAIFLDDVVSVLAAAVEDPAFEGQTFDVVNGESLSYEDLLRESAEALGKRRVMLPVPIASTGFSKRWVQLFSGASHELVSPLIDSLQCDLPRLEPQPVIARHITHTTFKSMIAETLRRSPEAEAGAPPPTRSRARMPKQVDRTVRSLQRLPSIANHDARFVSDEYMRWLPRFFRPFIRVERVPGTARVTFSLAFLRPPLLVLELIDLGADRARDKFHIVGGLLTKTTTTGWLEFRQVAHKRYTLAAIQGFVPSLPWLIYLLTQAPVHAWVMRAFGKHLERRLREGA